MLELGVNTNEFAAQALEINNYLSSLFNSGKLKNLPSLASNKHGNIYVSIHPNSKGQSDYLIKLKN